MLACSRRRDCTQGAFTPGLAHFTVKQDLLDAIAAVAAHSVQDMLPFTLENGLADFISYLDENRENLIPEPISIEGEKSEIPLAQQRAYRLILDFSEKLFKDLREVSYRFIEIGDFNPDGMYELSDESIENIKKTINTLRKQGIRDLSLHDKERIYKQVYFLMQYLESILQNDSTHEGEIKGMLDGLGTFKKELFKDPELIFSLMEVDTFDEDKKALKLAKKDARKMMKQMMMDKENISLKELKQAQMLFTFDVGEGSAGQFFLVLLKKLWVQITKLFTGQFFRKSE